LYPSVNPTARSASAQEEAFADSPLMVSIRSLRTRELLLLDPPMLGALANDPSI
jgi:hypothetical protein